MSEHFLKSLVQYLRNNFSGYTLYAGHWPENRSAPCILIVEAGGTRPFDGIYTHGVAITIEDDSYMDARSICYEFHDYLLDGKGLTLPAVETGDNTIQAEVVEIVSLPQYLGEDERKRFTWTFNLVIRR